MTSLLCHVTLLATLVTIVLVERGDARECYHCDNVVAGCMNGDKTVLDRENKIRKDCQPTQKCYKLIHHSQGKNNVWRDCLAPVGKEDVCTAAKKLHRVDAKDNAECSSCEKDRCNSAPHLSITRVLLAVTIVTAGLAKSFV